MRWPRCVIFYKKSKRIKVYRDKREGFIVTVVKSKELLNQKDKSVNFKRY